MIIPVNGHLLIEPVKHESFMASEKETYEEVGIVVSLDEALAQQHIFDGDEILSSPKIEVGMRVYFDGWLAAKYPKNADEYYWLVSWNDVRAVEHA